MSTRTPEQRARDNARVEQALLGKLIPAHDRRIHTKVVGVTARNDDGTWRQTIIDKMIQFEFVDLVRDPDDEYDSNAIEVHATLFDGPPGRQELRRVQIGHVDAELAAELAPALDAGEQWGAITTRVGGPISRGVSLMLFRKIASAASAEPVAGAVLPEWHCKKCGHTWFPRSAKRPRVCPRCNNQHWEKGQKRAYRKRQAPAVS